MLEKIKEHEETVSRRTFKIRETGQDSSEVDVALLRRAADWIEMRGNTITVLDMAFRWSCDDEGFEAELAVTFEED